jgi:diadenylate cyclase
MEMLEMLKGFFFNYIVAPIKTFGVMDAIDIILLAIVFYYVLTFIRDRRARNLIVGLVALGIVYFLTGVFGLNALHTLFSVFFSAYTIFIVIMFQYDLRDALDKIGTSLLRLRQIGTPAHSIASLTATVGVLSEAACDLSKEKCGALIVIERDSKLGDYIKTGVELDANMSCELLGNLFFNRSPLHDGAVIIRNGKIRAAGCILPSSKSTDIPKELGTRHRAAVGISEQSDAVVIVVSEETGNISIANNGILKRGYNSGTLKDDLFLLLSGNTEEENRRILQNATKKEEK